MVGGGNNTIAGIIGETEMEGMLGDMKKSVYQNKVVPDPDSPLALLENCLDKLENKERDLLVDLCVEGMSERAYASMQGLTRYRVREEKKRLISLLTGAYNASLRAKNK